MNLAVCLSTRVRFGVTIFEKSIQITGSHQISDEARFFACFDGIWTNHV